MEQQASLFSKPFVIAPASKIVQPPSNAAKLERQAAVNPTTDGPAFDDIWYHHAALAKMYRDLDKPLPLHILLWAKTKVDFLDAVSVVNPDEYHKIPLFKLMSAYGIYYGVHGDLENYHLATGKVNHDNIVDISRRMATIISMRAFLQHNWDHLLDSNAAWVTPPNPMGCQQVKCTFALTPSYSSGYSDGCGSLRTNLVPRPGMHRLLMETELTSADIDPQSALIEKAMEENVEKILEA